MGDERLLDLPLVQGHAYSIHPVAATIQVHAVDSGVAAGPFKKQKITLKTRTSDPIQYLVAPKVSDDLPN